MQDSDRSGCEAFGSFGMAQEKEINYAIFQSCLYLLPISSACATLARLSPDLTPPVPLLHCWPSACAASTNLSPPHAPPLTPSFPFPLRALPLPTSHPNLPPSAFCLCGFDQRARNWLSILPVPPLLSRRRLTLSILRCRTAACVGLTWMCCFGCHRGGQGTGQSGVGSHAANKQRSKLPTAAYPCRCNSSVTRSLSSLFRSPTALECCKSSLSVPHHIAI
jgi:hypothetical protein